MTSQRLCPSFALLRSLPRASSFPQCLRPLAVRHQRALHSSRHLAKERQSFEGQLLDSTIQRVKRERAERDRFADARSGLTDTRGRAIGMTIRKHDRCRYHVQTIPY